MLSVRLSYHLVECIDDLLPHIRQRLHEWSKLVRSDRSDFERMKHNRSLFNFKCRIETWETDGIQVRLSYQRNGDSSSVIIEDR